eukprot:4442355-Alexandrium_andersonii.AAC.1
MDEHARFMNERADCAAEHAALLRDRGERMLCLCAEAKQTRGLEIACRVRDVLLGAVRISMDWQGGRDEDHHVLEAPKHGRRLTHWRYPPDQPRPRGEERSFRHLQVERMRTFVLTHREERVAEHARQLRWYRSEAGITWLELFCDFCCAGGLQGLELSCIREQTIQHDLKAFVACFRR